MIDVQQMEWYEWMTYPFGAPVVFSIIVLFSTLCEIHPEYVNGINSNVATSLVRWNVSLSTLNYQLMNYILYHRRKFSQIIHGVTFSLDGLLWTMQFHHFIKDTPIWRYFFIFFAASVQILTYNDWKVRIFLMHVHFGYFVLGGICYRLTADIHWMFALTSLLLVVNALLRVLSHAPEPLPINYFSMKNPLPIANWWKMQEVYTLFLQKPLTMYWAVCIAFCSELQAGLPVRLVNSSWLMVAYKFAKFSTPRMNIPLFESTANYIEKRGFWNPDQDKVTLRKTAGGAEGEAEETDRFEPYVEWMQKPPTTVDFELGLMEAFKANNTEESKVISTFYTEGSNALNQIVASSIKLKRNKSVSLLKKRRVNSFSISEKKSLNVK